MSDWDVARAATALRDAEARRTDRGPLTDEWPDLDLSTAYAVQDETLSRRLARGEAVVGVQLALISGANQQRMGIDVPLTGWPTDTMLIPAGAPVPRSRLIHPREPKIVFLLGERLCGPGVTAASAMRCGVRLRRHRDRRLPLQGLVLHAARRSGRQRFLRWLSDGALGLPPRTGPFDRGLSARGERAHRRLRDRRDSAGHPAEALAMAANSLAERGLALEAGWTVLTVP